MGWGITPDTHSGGVKQRKDNGEETVQNQSEARVQRAGHGIGAQPTGGRGDSGERYRRATRQAQTWHKKNKKQKETY